MANYRLRVSGENSRSPLPRFFLILSVSAPHRLDFTEQGIHSTNNNSFFWLGRLLCSYSSIDLYPYMLAFGRWIQTQLGQQYSGGTPFYVALSSSRQGMPSDDTPRVGHRNLLLLLQYQQQQARLIEEKRGPLRLLSGFRISIKRGRSLIYSTTSQSHHLRPIYLKPKPQIPSFFLLRLVLYDLRLSSLLLRSLSHHHHSSSPHTNEHKRTPTNTSKNKQTNKQTDKRSKRIGFQLGHHAEAPYLCHPQPYGLNFKIGFTTVLLRSTTNTTF